MLSILLLLAQTAVPSEHASIKSLLHVARENITQQTVMKLGLDVASVTRNGEVELLCDAAEREKLVHAGIPFTVVHEDLAAFYASRLTPSERITSTPPLGAWLSPPFGSGGMGGYYTFVQLVSVLDQIHAAYPSLTTAKFSIGTSIQGRTLWAIKVSDNPDTDENEPEMRFDALHHAREPESMQCNLWTMLALLERYGTDPLSTYLVNEREIWFVPCVNPDGYVYNQSTDPSGGGLWRKNRRTNAGGSFGVDLNRNYDFEWGFDNGGSDPTPTGETYRGTAPASEPEVAAMQAFSAAHSFRTSLSAHTYSDLWLWPWGYIAATPPNNAQYSELGNLATANTGWTAGPAGIVLYLANGVSDDYEHATNATLAFSPEIGSDNDGFWPATSRIIPLAQDAEPGFLRTAWAAGAYVHDTARTASELGDGDGAYEPGESLRLVINVRNSGRAAAAAVDLGLTCSTPGITITTGLVALGSVASFSSASNAGTPLELAIGAVANGTRVDYVATLTYEGFTQELPGSFVVGTPRLVLTDDLESNVGWTVGAPGDGATTGIWAYGNPVGTTNGGPSNPEDDATPGAGVRCFATGNGSTTAGGDDVDGGPTTLTSPRLDLSGITNATLRYKRWFANSSVVNDALDVSVSDDDGSTWVPLEHVTGSNANAWNDASFQLADFVTLTDRVRLRFVTGDQPNDSITEAAVDELSLVTYDAGAKLNFYGRGNAGSQLALHVAANPSQPYAVRVSTATANIPLAFGTLLIQPSGSFVILNGTTGANGFARTLATIPSGLSGSTFYAQVLTLGPLGLSNRAAITFP